MSAAGALLAAAAWAAGRGGAGQAVSGVSERALLWPGATVHYLVATDQTHADAPEAFLAADDPRVAAAVAGWASSTCLTFTSCDPAALATCPQPYLTFMSSARACRSPVGRRGTAENPIYVAPVCTAGDLMHEIGHALGLANTHERPDADDYVRIDRTQIAPGEEPFFDAAPTPGAALHLGPYDYGSIMHLPSGAYAKGAMPTIVAPVPIGQREQLSAGDVASVEFLYHACDPDYGNAAPTCMASRSSITPTVIPQGKAWSVEFTVVYDADAAAYANKVTVGYASTDVPMARRAASVADGGVVDDLGKVAMSFTPSLDDVGATFTLAASFTNPDDTTKTVECAVAVSVAAGNTVCYGVAGDDPAVCSGHGTCRDDPMKRCVCQDGFTGLLCDRPFDLAEVAPVWAGATVPYIVAPAETHIQAPAPFLAADDVRIEAAVAAWAAATCLTFTECDATAPDACATPHVTFISSALGCTHPTSLGRSDAPFIYVAPACTAGDLMHEIGHALGLPNTHERPDAADYVYVDRAQIAPDQAAYFDTLQAGDAAMHLGPYDYGSIMHLPSGAYAKGAMPTIVAPVPIGQREQLSAGDVASVEFMYHGCVAEYTAPTCMASRRTDAPTLIPYGQPWTVEFAVVYSAPVTVSWEQSNVPEGMVVFGVVEGAEVGPAATVGVRFTPSLAEVDGVFRAAAKFASVQDPAREVVCSADVRVAPSPHVCYGVAGDDPAVCSGHGTCEGTPSRCTCDAGFGGARCASRALWEHGVVHYVVALTESDPSRPAAFLAADDPRIAAAVAVWRDSTCLTFTPCDPLNPTACPDPHLRFISTAGACRTADVGRAQAGANPLYVAAACTTGSIVHEIGHALGLPNAHVRPDAADYVHIDRTQIAPGEEQFFDAAPTPAAALHLGPYDYGSVMHLAAHAYARSVLPTIVAPVPIGQREQLSAGDVARIEFMYHGCVAEYTAPTCMASRGTDAPTLIPYGKPWTVEFTLMYDEAMVVTYTGSTAPEAMLATSVAAGGTVDKVGRATVTFTPTAAEQGQLFALAAKAAAVRAPQETVECAVEVEVAAADTVCYGVGGNDVEVCSGHGECRDDPPQRCVCGAGYSGAFCEKLRSWEHGVVHYLVALTESDPAAPAAFLAADDARVHTAVALWADGTCLDFRPCDPLAPGACPLPHLKFVSTGGACRSPLGRRLPGANPLYVSQNCSAGGVAHQIGHALGLPNTHERPDAADYVYVDRAQIAPGKETLFDITDAASAPISFRLGPYDYGSIMHLPSGAYAKGAMPTIVAPVPIGQREQLSAGDVASVEFMYHGCVAEYTAPTCMASRGTDVPTLIPYGKPWTVEFTLMYDEAMVVTYTGSTAPEAMLATSVAAGGTVDKVGRATVTFTPTAAEGGKAFVLAVGAASVNDAAATAACAVEVEVAAADTVCWGVASSDPAVCSGRGVCQEGPQERCVCDDGFAGERCEDAATTQVPLWGEGAVRYLVAVGASDQASPATFLTADDARVAAAVAAWQEATCLTFVPCDPLDAAACAPPYLQFISSARGCHAPLGRRSAGANPLYIAPACTAGDLMHEIGHALGLPNTHERPDAADYVYVDRAQIAPDQAAYFDTLQAGDAAMHLGPYDYGSIMHLPSGAYAKGAMPTIVAPVPIGQRAQLSAGDVASVEFMYHGCVAEYTAPTCMASRGTDAPTLIPYGKPWSVEMTGMYSDSMGVSYVGGDVPQEVASASVAEGGRVAPGGRTVVTLTPSVEHAGRTFEVVVRFSDVANPALGAACRVRVVVADADAVCYGVAGGNASACSGHGECGDAPGAPRCTCDAGHSGLLCENDTAYRLTPEFDASPEGLFETQLAWCAEARDCRGWGDAAAECDVEAARCVCSDGGGFGPVASAAAGREAFWCVPGANATAALAAPVTFMYLFDYPLGRCDEGDGASQEALLATVHDVLAAFVGDGVLGGAWMCLSPAPAPAAVPARRRRFGALQDQPAAAIPRGTRVVMAVDTNARRVLEATPPTLADDFAEATRFVPGVAAAIGSRQNAPPVKPDVTIVGAATPYNATAPPAGCGNVTNATEVWVDAAGCTPVACGDGYALNTTTTPHACELARDLPLFDTAPEYKDAPEYDESPAYKSTPAYLSSLDDGSDDDDDALLIGLLTALGVLLLCSVLAAVWWFVLRKKEGEFEHVVSVWVPVDDEAGSLHVDGVPRGRVLEDDADEAAKEDAEAPGDAASPAGQLVPVPDAPGTPGTVASPRTPGSAAPSLGKAAKNKKQAAKTKTKAKKKEKKKPTPGVLLTSVAEGSPAALAGLAPGQVLLAVDGKKVTSMDGAAAAVVQRKKPDGVWVKVGVLKDTPADPHAAAAAAAALATTLAAMEASGTLAPALDKASHVSKQTRFAPEPYYAPDYADLETPRGLEAPLLGASATRAMSPQQAANQALLAKYRVPAGHPLKGAGYDPPSLTTPREGGAYYSPPGDVHSPIVQTRTPHAYSPVVDPAPLSASVQRGFSPLPPVGGAPRADAAHAPAAWHAGPHSPHGPPDDDFVDRNVYCPSRGVCALPFLEITNGAPPNTRTLVLTEGELRCERNSGAVERAVPLEHVADLLHTDDGLVGLVLPAEPADWCLQFTPQYAKTFLVALGNLFLERTGLPLAARRVDAASLVARPLQQVLRLDAVASPQRAHGLLLEGP